MAQVLVETPVGRETVSLMAQVLVEIPVSGRTVSLMAQAQVPNLFVGEVQDNYAKFK